MRHFITYGDDRFKHSKQRIKKEAENLGIFDTISVYTPEDLPQGFKNKFDFILNMKKGGGYYIWKPLLVYNMLNNINDGDYLVYLDSGCTLNKNGIERYYQYEQMIKDSGILGMQLGQDCLERYYTTDKVFEHFNCDEDVKNTGQIQGGILVIKKCEKSINIVKTWVKTLYDNPLLFTDFYNVKKEGFIDHRHDQSIFSVIMKTHGGSYIPDETWSADWSDKKLTDKPFWATRLRI